ncbi:hypothetical protein KAR91_48630 [Candidatus Pacearchaeota archaeon]|nr:hypothetical protein [Candidatus Pacearchaeota archaeon]
MKRRLCHFCQKRKVLIIFPNGDGLCPRCHSNLYLKEQPLPAVIRKQMNFTPVIDINGTLEYISAQLMCNFIHNGMSVSNVSRQLGMTRSTVYARLRKYNLIRPSDEDKVILQPTLSDIDHCNGLSRIRKVDKKCK